MDGLCANGRCENQDGGFRCVCPSGFLLSDDGRTCIGNVNGCLICTCMFIMIYSKIFCVSKSMKFILHISFKHKNVKVIYL